jgi:hypothetical protein
LTFYISGGDGFSDRRIREIRPQIEAISQRPRAQLDTLSTSLEKTGALMARIVPAGLVRWARVHAHQDASIIAMTISDDAACVPLEAGLLGR